MYYLVEWVENGNGRYYAGRNELVPSKCQAFPHRTYESAKEYRDLLEHRGKKEGKEIKIRIVTR